MKKNQRIKRNKDATHKRAVSGFFVVSFTIFLFGITLYCIFIGHKVVQAAQTVFVRTGQTQESAAQTFSKLLSKPNLRALRGYTDGRINVLLLGIAGEDTVKKGRYLTDTIIVASIDTINHRLALLSLPRDLLVETDEGLNKINAFYTIGKIYEKSDAISDRSTITNQSTKKESSSRAIIISNESEEPGSADQDNDSTTKKQLGKTTALDYSIDAVQTVTDLTIHYSLVMDFEGFRGIVDALNGIKITVPRTIDDPLYPGPNYSYEPFYIEKGFHTLDGSTALKYVRTRHDDPESDFGRAKRQQDVMQAIRNKALSLGTLTNPRIITDLLQTISKHTETTISTKEVRSFLALFEQIDTHNITNVVIDAWKKESLLISTNIKTPVGALSGLAPRTGSWDEIQEYADEIFSLDKITLRRDAVVAEDASITIIAPPNNHTTTKRIIDVLKGLRITNITTQLAPASEDIRQQSSIIDYTSGTKPFTLDTITKRITPHITQDTFTQSISPPLDDKLDQIAIDRDTESTSSTDILITIGQDLIEQYSYEEADRNMVEKEFGPLPPKSTGNSTPSTAR